MTSLSTASTDRREKRVAYQSIPELDDYLIVDPDERRVEHYRRDADRGWWVHEYRDDGTINLPWLQLELTLADIYEGLYVLRRLTAEPKGGLGVREVLLTGSRARDDALLVSVASNVCRPL